jgi:hypothetical protein
MNPNRPQDRLRLSKSLQHSYEELRWGRVSIRDLILDFAGPMYGAECQTRPDVYVNLMQMQVNAWQVALSYNDPRFVISSPRAEQWSFAERYQVALNTYSQRIRLGDTLRELLRDAIFLVGIGKIHLADSPQVQVENDLWMDPGMPMFGRVAFENWVHDVTKSHFRYADFLADRYTMDLEKAKANPAFKKSVRERLEATKPSDRSDRSELASAISSYTDHDDFELEEKVALVDVYLTKERLVCTYAVHDQFELLETEPLAVHEWTGSETGPFRFLSFIDVQDNIMPTSLAQTTSRLSGLHNYMWRRIARRIKQAKTLLPYDSDGAEDMNKLMHAEDYQTVKVRHMKSFGAFDLPGPSQNQLNLAHTVFQLWDISAGNITAMAGMGPSADTLGQEQMIEQRVSAQIADSRRKFNRFVSDAGQDVGDLLFDDPVQELPGQRQVPGTDLTIDSSWMPPEQLQRQGTAGDYMIRVEPYSMEFKTPEMRLAAIRGYVQSRLPLIPLYQQVGKQFDVEALDEIEAELLDEPRIKRLWKNALPQMELQEGPSAQSNAPHRYIRENKSTRSNNGALQQLMTQQSSEDVPQLMTAG